MTLPGGCLTFDAVALNVHVHAADDHDPGERAVLDDVVEDVHAVDLRRGPRAVIIATPSSTVIHRYIIRS